MEPKKQTQWRNWLPAKGLFLCTLLMSSGLEIIAQNSNGTGSSKITVGEIVMYVSIILVVIVVAWFFASRQTDKIDKEHHDHMVHHPPKKHYDHPNDPHFRKLRKKTS
ncbi:MAG TPA: hypothetical protein VK826_09160 [Bacteroidia bacterium]|nr:hypothetical protein [Bacteroidia bacterium]